MGSGKTARLIELAEQVPRGNKLIFSKTKNGEGWGSIRHAKQIVSRNGKTIRCDDPYDYGEFVHSFAVLPKWCTHVFMDEGQWWNRFYVNDVKLLSQKGIKFYISLLDRTYTGEYFYEFLQWAEVADEIEHLHGICAVTGSYASYSELLTDHESTRKEDYRAVCEEVFKKSKHCKI